VCSEGEKRGRSENGKMFSVFRRSSAGLYPAPLNHGWVPGASARHAPQAPGLSDREAESFVEIVMVMYRKKAIRQLWPDVESLSKNQV
jgi:hypothetical protein